MDMNAKNAGLLAEVQRVMIDNDMPLHDPHLIGDGYEARTWGNIDGVTVQWKMDFTKMTTSEIIGTGDQKAQEAAERLATLLPSKRISVDNNMVYVLN